MKPDKVARALLDEYWDMQLPVDPEYFANQLKLTVVRDSNMKMRTAYLDLDTREIHVNANEPPDRQRLLIARELGHYCLGHGSTKRDTTNPDWVKHLNTEDEDKAAVEFAVALTMPSTSVTKIIDKDRVEDMSKVRSFFRIAPEAFFYRLYRMGYLG